MGKGRICSVPFCPTKSGSGISLHEIPSNAIIREKWLKRISRADSVNPSKNWVPGSRSAVCSQHFLESDYIANHKQRRLKNDAVPSVFPQYPSHKTSFEKTSRKLPFPRTAVPEKRRRTETVELEPVPPGITECLELAQQDTNELCTESKPKSNLGSNKLEQRIKQLMVKVRNLRCSIRRKKQTILSLRTVIQNSKPKESFESKQLEKIKSDADSGNVKALLLLQQIEGYGKSRFRWSELCIRMCVLWRSKSPRAYNFARQKFVNLPCPTTLQNYIGPSNLQTGLTDLGKIRLQEELQNKTKNDTMCSLIFDEMSITPKLLYRKQADKIIGKAEYGRGATTDRGGLANRLLCFVLKGLASNYRIPVAYYLTCQLQGADLSKLILDVISHVENIGFKICRLVCDDATTNVKALEMICSGKLHYEIVHPIRNTDPLFISFDPCHIIKNIRNQFLDDDRNLSIHNKPISSKPIKFLYENHKYLPIKPVRFLTRKTVYPTSFEKMNVKRAIQIFSTEVIAALEFCGEKNLPGFRNLEATIEFMKNVHKWFVIHNVCNTTHHITSRDEDRKHFGMVDDERLEWLEMNFLGYLQSWSQYAQQRQQTKGNSKTQTFLTKETFKAIMITTMSTVTCIRYLIRSGFHFVLTRKFNSDDVEGIFSAVRASQGRNDQANAVGSLYAIETILKTGLFSSSVYGNCLIETQDSISSSCKRKNIIEGKTPEGRILTLTPKQQLLANKLKNPPDIPNATTKTAGVAMVAGFALRLLKDRHPCLEAGSNLAGNCDEPTNLLISLQDRGGLMYPSLRFVRLVKLIFDILDASDSQFEQEAVVKSWMMTLIDLLPEETLLCGCADASHTVLLRTLIIGSLCKIYFNNVCFNVTNAANEKPKYTSKPASKKIKKL